MAALLLAGCGGGGGEQAADGGPAVLRIHVDPIAKHLAYNEHLAKEFTDRTGVQVEFIKGPTDATDRLSQYSQYFGARSHDVDVYQVDVTWPGLLAEHLVDLTEAFAAEKDDFFAPIIENNTVDGKLVALPWFADAGVLYYRTDLLEKHGKAVPATWEELEATAQAVQEAERAGGASDFWGFVWQGKAYEGLTCNALEWIASYGGGRIVEGDRTVSINNPSAVTALSRAAGWPGTISPPGVTTYQEEEARQLFQGGNALFMRNWPYAYSLANAEDSPVKGKVGVVVLPSGGAGNAACLGGWQLAVSRYSRRQTEAIELVRHLCSAEAQKGRAIEASLLPTRMATYEDAEAVAAIPFLPMMKDVFLSATPRPTTVTADRYNEVSTAFFQAVHRVLTGQQEADDALEELETAIAGIVR